MTFKKGRDPFGRLTITKVEATIGAPTGCDWCGNRDLNGKVWYFKVDPDSIRDQSFFMQGAFCSVACARTYHGG